jgi:hypothetical protein
LPSGTDAAGGLVVFIFLARWSIDGLRRILRAAGSTGETKTAA